MPFFENMHYEPSCNLTRLKWDLERIASRKVNDRKTAAKFHLLTPDLFERSENIWMDIGAGSGSFFAELARLHPDRFLIAIERSKLRGQRLAQKARKVGYPNWIGLRGNCIPALIHGVPTEKLERIYVMYPCPWPKNSQRKNRWYLHPIMPHLVRALKPGGLLIWTSDQQFYIDEAKWVCESFYHLRTLIHGPIQPNRYNHMNQFPGGRTKFERDFLGRGLPCYELIVQRPLHPIGSVALA